MYLNSITSNYYISRYTIVHTFRNRNKIFFEDDHYYDNRTLNYDVINQLIIFYHNNISTCTYITSQKTIFYRNAIT